MPRIQFQIQRRPTESLSPAEEGEEPGKGIGTIVALLGLGWVLFVATGCNEPNTIRGTVTYDGQPVQKGAISFLPSDGRGPSVGAKITDGSFFVENASPGSCIVQIVGVREINFARSSGELERMADEARAAGKNPNDLVEQADVIPDNADGNNQLVEVKEGGQTLDFHITPPAE